MQTTTLNAPVVFSRHADFQRTASERRRHLSGPGAGRRWRSRWESVTLISVDRVSAASFIGRAPELAELEAALADAREGRPRLVFLAGESGVGKSRLLSEFRRRSRGVGSAGDRRRVDRPRRRRAPLRPARRRRAAAGPRRTTPSSTRSPTAARAELARLAPELGERASERGEDREGEAQRRLFDALLSLLEQLGQEQATVFWLEDIHWADRSTRSFLAFLEASLREERVLVVSTYRSDELHRRHPLRPLLGELERGPCSRRIDLSRFDRDELAAAARPTSSARAPDDDLVDRLYKRSEGNALFTEELLAGGLDGRGGAAADAARGAADAARAARRRPAGDDRPARGRRARRRLAARRGQRRRRRIGPRRAPRGARAPPPANRRRRSLLVPPRADPRGRLRRPASRRALRAPPGARPQARAAGRRAARTASGSGPRSPTTSTPPASSARRCGPRSRPPSAPRPTTPSARRRRSSTARWRSGRASTAPRSSSAATSRRR